MNNASPNLFERKSNINIVTKAAQYDFANDNRFLITFIEYEGIDVHFGFANKNGEVVIPAKYDIVYNDFLYADDLIIVGKRFEINYGTLEKPRIYKWFLQGLINSKGVELIPCKYKNLYTIRNNKLYLADNCVLLDSNGTEIIPYGRYLKIYDDFISGFSRTLSNTHLWGVIDINGNEIIKEGTFNKIWPIKNDYSSIVVERDRIRYEIPFAVLEKLQEELKVRGEITTSVEQYLNYKEYLQQDFLESGEVTLTREELQN